MSSNRLIYDTCTYKHELTKCRSTTIHFKSRNTKTPISAGFRCSWWNCCFSY